MQILRTIPATASALRRGRAPAAGLRPVCRARRASSQQREKFSGHGRQIQLRLTRMAFGNCHHISAGQCLRMETEKFPQEPLDAIARHRVSHLAGNRHARPARSVRARQQKKQKMRAVQAATVFVADGEFRPAPDSRLLGVSQKWNAVCGRPQRSSPGTVRLNSGAQTLAALGAATADDGAAAGRGHARAKTVRAGTADLARLICSFHGVLPLKYEVCERRAGRLFPA